MGNIHFEQKKYDLTIKNYNMAIDSTTQQNKEMKMKNKKNMKTNMEKYRILVPLWVLYFGGCWERFGIQKPFQIRA